MLGQNHARWMLRVTIWPACWLGMMLAHELGHLLAAWMVGAKVEKVILHPFSFSRTDVAANDHLLFIVWMGPVVGTVLPLMLWLVSLACKATFAFVLRFFAGFCLIANGLYLGVGWIDAVGDAGDLLRMGVPAWLLTIVGAVATLGGLCLWHGQASSFGLGKAARDVSPRVALGVGLVLMLMAGLMFALSDR